MDTSVFRRGPSQRPAEERLLGRHEPPEWPPGGFRRSARARVLERVVADLAGIPPADAAEAQPGFREVDDDIARKSQRDRAVHKVVLLPDSRGLAAGPRP